MLPKTVSFYFYMLCCYVFFFFFLCKIFDLARDYIFIEPTTYPNFYFIFYLKYPKVEDGEIPCLINSLPCTVRTYKGRTNKGLVICWATVITHRTFYTAIIYRMSMLVGAWRGLEPEVTPRTLEVII